MNIALVLSYDGTNYNGWQVQKNGPSIQESMETAVFRLLGQKAHVSGVGRTDSGVHARRYVASFQADCTIPMARLPYALNSFLPRDIAVSGAAAGAGVRSTPGLTAPKRNMPTISIPPPCATRFTRAMPTGTTTRSTLRKCRQGAQRFVGRQDFAAVRSQGTPVKSTVRTVFWCEVEPVGELIRIRVCGDGFLYNMVRAIAGTLAYVGGGKLTPDDVTAILRSGDREQAGPTLPANGLFMNRLWYEHTPALDPFQLGS